MMRDGMIHELDVGLWDQTIAVNVRGYMLCAKHVVPAMLERGGGVIVKTPSGAGMQAEVTRAAYDKGRAYEFWGVADDQASLNSFWTD